LIKRAVINRIEVQKPKKFSEKISKKNPAKKALIIPEFLLGFSKKFTRITMIKIRPVASHHQKTALKCTKKLVCNKTKT